MLSQLRERVTRDPLTGLRASLPAAPGTAGVVLLDVDGLGDVNDIGGQAAGDDVLRATAGLLRELMPPGSQAFRIGSDEFVVTLDPRQRLARPSASAGSCAPRPRCGIGRTVSVRRRRRRAERRVGRGGRAARGRGVGLRSSALGSDGVASRSHRRRPSRDGVQPAVAPRRRRFEIASLCSATDSGAPLEDRHCSPPSVLAFHGHHERNAFARAVTRLQPAVHELAVAVELGARRQIDLDDPPSKCGDRPLALDRLRPQTPRARGQARPASPRGR